MILLIGDLHITEKNTERWILLQKRVDEILAQGTFKTIILLGDILDNHGIISRRAMYSITCWLEKLHKFQIICLVGNHDMDHNQRFCETDSHWMAALKHMGHVVIVDVPMIISTHVGKIAAFPYVPPGRFGEAANMVNVSDCCLVVAHQEFANGQLSESIISSCLEEYTLPILCISGHLHRTHEINGSKANVLYSGSAFAHSFGQPKCWLWTFDGILVDKLENGVPGKMTKIVTLDKMASFDFDDSMLTLDFLLIIVANSIADYSAWQQSTIGKSISAKCRVQLRLQPKIEQQTILMDFDSELVMAVPLDCRNMLHKLTTAGQLTFDQLRNL